VNEHLAFGVVLDALDGLHLPDRADASAPLYKEWQHFYLLDEGNGLHAIVNMNLAGAVTAGAGPARVLIAVWERERGWCGGVDTVPPGELRVGQHRVDMRMGPAALRFDGTAYYLRLADRRGRIEGELALRPLAAPLMMRNNTPVGRGYINWLVVPRLAVAGRLAVDDRAYAVTGGQGYHDHNWGRWQWGDDFAWEWGFAVPGASAAGPPWTLVYDRTTDRGRLAVKELTVALWEGDALARVFTRREVQVRGEGFMPPAPLLKLPGIMALVEPQRTHDIPAALHIEASAFSDHLEAEFRAEHAVQVIVPNDGDLQNTIINEVFGRFTARGQIRGQPVALSGLSFFEFLT
jgi:hypothetical protein